VEWGVMFLLTHGAQVRHLTVFDTVWFQTHAIMQGYAYLGLEVEKLK